MFLCPIIPHLVSSKLLLVIIIHCIPYKNQHLRQYPVGCQHGSRSRQNKPTFRNKTVRWNLLHKCRVLSCFMVVISVLLITWGRTGTYYQLDKFTIPVLCSLIVLTPKPDFTRTTKRLRLMDNVFRAAKTLPACLPCWLLLCYLNCYLLLSNSQPI